MGGKESKQFPISTEDALKRGNILMGYIDEKI